MRGSALERALLPVRARIGMPVAVVLESGSLILERRMAIQCMPKMPHHHVAMAASVSATLELAVARKA